MRSTITIAVCALALTLATPALARTSYVTDGAAIFSPAAVAALNAQIGEFAQSTGKEVVVVTEDSLAGRTVAKAAEDTFAREQVNGVLFYFAKAEKQDEILGDKASHAFFAPGSFTNIHDAMRGYLRGGDPDQAIKTGVNLVLDQYRSHARAPVSAQQTTTTRQLAPSSRGTSFGGGMGLFWLALFLIVGFLIIRAIFRAIAGPRMMPPGQGMGPGMGPGYGAGYGGGGGGGFFSGLLGGLGGAWIGNEMFGHQNQNIINGGGAGSGDGSASSDSSGWQSDAGQADTSDAGGGSWGDSGGGFDSGGGGGDSGGGW